MTLSLSCFVNKPIILPSKPINSLLYSTAYQAYHMIALIGFSACQPIKTIKNDRVDRVARTTAYQAYHPIIMIAFAEQKTIDRVGGTG